MEEGKGYITVNVLTAGGALPVSGALITISLTNGGEVVGVMTSDISGSTDLIELSAPPRENSLEPGNTNVSTLYNIDTDREGYYHVINTGVPVFDGVTSIQQVIMVPIARADTPLQPNDLTRFDESELPDL